MEPPIHDPNQIPNRRENQDQHQFLKKRIL